MKSLLAVAIMLGSIAAVGVATTTSAEAHFHKRHHHAKFHKHHRHHKFKKHRFFKHKRCHGHW
jgi:hypothetical protein